VLILDEPFGAADILCSRYAHDPDEA